MRYIDIDINIRDYFAAQALNGLLSRAGAQGDQVADEVSRNCYKAAVFAYEYADAMIDARYK